MTVAELVKELRKITGAAILDCKNAIEESNGDLEAAKDWIRSKGLARATSIAGRTASEGVVAVNVEGNQAVIIELNSETDFVAKNEQFQTLVQKILDVGINSQNLESLKAIKLDDGKTVEEEIENNIAIIREKLSLRRSQTMNVKHGAIGYYIHNKVAPNMGRTAVLVALESENEVENLKSLANDIAMHIAASKPLASIKDDLDPAHVERERLIFQEQASLSGKPENVVTKMVEGMMRKFYQEVVLLEQCFILDQKQTINQILDKASEEFGSKIKIKNFVKYEVGEGIIQKAKNFADEVASITKQ